MLKMDDEEFLILVDFIKTRYGINLAQKRALLEGRLSQHIAARGFSDFTSYAGALQSPESERELADFLSRITTNHTYFMREPEHFAFFRDRVLPYWEQRLTSRDLRCWCAASSTGEEPYTLAMILQDYFGANPDLWDTRLLATDLSPQALEKAWQGSYPRETVQKLPEMWLRKYFISAPDDRVQVRESLKQQVVFRQFNLMDPIVAKRPFHVVFCRNVMIYFDSSTKEELVNRIYDCMAPGGFLFVGHTEALSRPMRFTPIMPSVYQKGG